ncbi:MAG: creatininase family protein, partial [Candidatus Eremiobacteraeota bacterium]|nr:creatininase family protein [Candidatus Eremiobacteraeota bacterium]
MRAKYRYGEMPWPEIREAATERRVAVVPIATIEDHGPHLPVDTDLVLCNAACDEAVSRVSDRAVLVPSINHGFSPHHMDFPGA